MDLSQPILMANLLIDLNAPPKGGQQVPDLNNEAAEDDANPLEDVVDEPVDDDDDDDQG